MVKDSVDKKSNFGGKSDKKFQRKSVWKRISYKSIRNSLSLEKKETLKSVVVANKGSLQSVSEVAERSPPPFHPLNLEELIEIDSVFSPCPSLSPSPTPISFKELIEVDCITSRSPSPKPLISSPISFDYIDLTDLDFSVEALLGS